MSVDRQWDRAAANPAHLFGMDNTRSWDRVSARDELSPREERELARRAQAGDKNARQRMIDAAAPLVTALVRNYGNVRVDRDDLIQEGMIGLCEALDRFDPEKGFRFSTYAAFWVKKRVLRCLYQQSRLIAVPVGLNRDSRRARTARERLTVELGREPSHEELAEACSVTAKRVEGALACPEDAMSLEGVVKRDAGEASLEIQDTQTPDPETLLMDEQRNSDLEKLLSSLPARDRLVLEGRFGLAGDTVPVADLAATLQTSCEVIRQIQHRALVRLRRSGKAEMLLA